MSSVKRRRESGDPPVDEKDIKTEERPVTRQKLDAPSRFSPNKVLGDTGKLLGMLVEYPFLIPSHKESLVGSRQWLPAFQSKLAGLMSSKNLGPEVLFSLLFYSGAFGDGDGDGDINAKIFVKDRTVLHFVAEEAPNENLERYLRYFLGKKACPFTGDSEKKDAIFLLSERDSMVSLEGACVIASFYPEKRHEILQAVRAYCFDPSFVEKWVFELGQDFAWIQGPSLCGLAADIRRSPNPSLWFRLYIQCGAPLKAEHSPIVAKEKLDSEYWVGQSYRLGWLSESLQEIEGFVPELVDLVSDYVGPVIAHKNCAVDGSTFGLYTFRLTAPQTKRVVVSSTLELQAYDKKSFVTAIEDAESEEEEEDENA